MMKKYFYSAIAASMLFACSQEDIVDVTGGESQMKTFKVEIPKVESRTVGGGITLGAGTQADALIYAMYENGTDEVLVSDVVFDGEGEENDGIFTVTVPMAKDLKYDLLFLAYNESNSAFEIASEAKSTNLKELKFKANQTANIDAFDAFTGALKAQGVNDANTVTLKRPFAQINAATSKTDMDNAKTLKLNVAKSNLVIKGVPASYNVLEGTASSTTIDVTYAANNILVCDSPAQDDYTNEKINVDGTDYYYLTLAYVLAGETTTTSTHNATFQFLREDDTSVSTLEIVSLPIQRNFRTNVIGDLLTKSEEYTITIDANFGPNDDQSHVVGVWDGKTEEVEDTDNDGIIEITNASQLAYIAKQVDGGETYSGKTIKLMNNIDLGNIAWNPIGVSGDSKPFSGTFDGNGKTISNLYVDLTDAPLYESAGLFANASGATIKNFTIQNAYVANRTVFIASSCGTAIVVGSGQGTTTIENVDVKDATIIADRYAGGIAGFYQGTIKDCDVDGIKISVTPNQNADGTKYDNGDKAGGIIGYVNSSGTLTNNTVNDFTIRAYRDMGGIVGGNYANVNGNKATNGTIIVDQVTNFYEVKDANAGEIVGRPLGGTTGTNTSENVTIITLTASNYVTSQETFATALQNGGTIYLGKNTASRAATADYTWTSASSSFEIIAVEDGVVIDMDRKEKQALGNGISASFEGVTLICANVNYSGFYASSSETYKNCHIEGNIWTYAPKAIFEGCTFNQTGDFYNIWMYGAATNEILVKDCEFTSNCKSILIYNESANKFDVTIENTTFNSENADGKAAVQMHTEKGIYGTLTMNDVTVSGAYLQFPNNGGLYNEINHNQKNDDGTYVTTNKFVKIINGKKTVGTADALKAAITAAKDGDVIYLADGTYTGLFKISNKNLTLKAVNKDMAIINGMIFGEGEKTIKLNALTLTNEQVFTIPNSNAGNRKAVVVAYQNNYEIEDCTFNLTDTDKYGFYDESNDGNNYNTIKNCVFNCNGNRPIMAKTNITVDGCTFNDQYKYSLQVMGQGNVDYTSKVIFTNNVIKDACKTSEKNDVQGLSIGKNHPFKNVNIEIKGNTSEGVRYVYDNVANVTSYWDTVTVTGDVTKESFVAVD